MKIDASMSRHPIFIHSLWRSSSTYFFSKFRASEGYFAYQEPLHEMVLNAVGNPEILNNLPAEAVKALRHPDMVRGHFHELFLTYPAWKDHINRDSIYRRYFDQRTDPELNAFFGSLIDVAPDRPVIQECRTSLRIKPIKENLGGFHIALVRNPWDQWWSFKATAYFEAILQLLLQSENLPPTLQWTRELIGFREFPSPSLNDEIAHFIHNPLDHKTSYRIFFTLWCLAWLHAYSNADLTINVDEFGTSPHYRRRIKGELSRVGIEGLDLDDYRIFIAPFASDAFPEFCDIEQSVLLQIQLGGAAISDLAALEAALKRFAALRAEYLNEGGTRVVLEALERRQETALLLQDGWHHLAAFYASKLSDERAAAFAEVERLQTQLREHHDRVEELMEEQRKQVPLEVSERETLKTVLAERSAASDARIRDLQGMLGTTQAALNQAYEARAVAQARLSQLEAELATKHSHVTELIEQYNALAARHADDLKKLAHQEAAARAEADGLRNRLAEEVSWRDDRLATADQLIREVRTTRGTFAARVRQRFASAFGSPEDRALDKALEGWQLAPAAVSHSQSPATSPADHRPMTDRPNPYLRANSLGELCAFHDLEFVRCAYVTLLGRQPDPQGEAYYAKRLRAGVAKLAIISQLRRSAEGQAHDPGIGGLDGAIKRYRRGQIPVLGYVYRLLSGCEGNSPAEMQLRAIINSIKALEQPDVNLKEEMQQIRAKTQWISDHLFVSMHDISSNLTEENGGFALTTQSIPSLDGEFTPRSREIYRNIVHSLYK